MPRLNLNFGKDSQLRIFRLFEDAFNAFAASLHGVVDTVSIQTSSKNGVLIISISADLFSNALVSYGCLRGFVLVDQHEFGSNINNMHIDILWINAYDGEFHSKWTSSKDECVHIRDRTVPGIELGLVFDTTDFPFPNDPPNLSFFVDLTKSRVLTSIFHQKKYSLSSIELTDADTGHARIYQV